eukprot:1706643-Ditylum_brightwellii.AAC.1
MVLKLGVRKWGNDIKQQLEMGRFAPSGLHLTTGEVVHKGLLRRQNAWLDHMSVVIIEGLSYNAMYVPVQFRGKMILLQTIMIRKDLYGFQQLEAATTVETKGK